MCDRGSQRVRKVTNSTRAPARGHAEVPTFSHDQTPIAQLDGVGVFTADDMKSVMSLRAQSRMRGYYATPLRPLAEGKVRCVGEPVVAIIAETRYLAEEAAS
jgi:carbon-monoxide dehydrogenase large subunit